MTPFPARTPEPAPAPATPEGDHRERPKSQAYAEFMKTGWAPAAPQVPTLGNVAPFAAARRAELASRYPGTRLVIPAGSLKVRANDTDYRFRPHSAFAHLTGLGTDQQPDAVLVLNPEAPDVLYVNPPAGRECTEFYADSRHGEFWVGARPTLDQLAAVTGLEVRSLADLPSALAQRLDVGTGLLVLPGADEEVTTLVEAVRTEAGLGQPWEDEAVWRDESGGEPTDHRLARDVAELRLIKDAWEIEQLRAAVAASVAGFEDIVRALPAAIVHPRGERVVESAFDARARQDGNDVGYETIAAAGDHATTLHWITNDGPVQPGDLLLVDAGVEVESLYTADVTRTLPISGKFSPRQAQVYQAVLDAADAAFAAAVPGVRFLEVHQAAMQVIANRLAAWGLLPEGVSAEEALSSEGGHHRRWMVHGTSHHLGLDVHDCAAARREFYQEAILEPGMVFTIEPGLYFKADDLAVPAEFRGIGVRIEDDVLVTETGVENLTAALPRSIAEVEAWMARLLGEAG